MTVDPREFRDAFGAFPTGVAVVTADGPDGPVGLTTNAITSVSLEPPLFLVCVAETSRSLPGILAAGALAVSILRATQGDVARRFASKDEAGAKFAGVPVDHCGGVPVIAGAAATIGGAIEQAWQAGDHRVLLCRVVEVRHDPAADPLTFHRGSFGELADELATS